MRGPWILDSDVYENWVKGRETALGNTFPLLPASVKSAVCLALLENNGRYLTYNDLNHNFERRGLFRGRKNNAIHLPVPTLRVAISELSKNLLQKNHFLELRSQRIGKTAQFALVDKFQNSEKQRGLFHAAHEPLIEPRDITRGLVRDGGALPFGSLYCCYRAAAQWLAFSSGQCGAKFAYEAKAFDAYRIDRKLGIAGFGGELGFIGLAPGEGLAELALLKRLLRDETKPRPKRLHYTALDTSEFLLSAHSYLVRERFAKELAEGRLVYAPLVGDIFQLRKCINQIRLSLGETYLQDMPVLCSYFGNCLGNYESHEWDIFRCLIETFPASRTSMLLGISLLRFDPKHASKPPLEENYRLDSFLLETPRHLMYEMELLRSEDDDGKPVPPQENKEFLISHADSSPILSSPYDTPNGIRGRVYRFFYKLQNSLTTWDGEQRLKRGSRILLYSIVKYDLKTLTDFLKERDFEIQAPPEEYETLLFEDGEQEFRYAVVGVSRGGK